MTAISFTFCIDADHPALPGHFPGRPVVPGVLLLDEVLSGLSAIGVEVTRIARVKFLAVLLPGDPARVKGEATGGEVTFSVTTRRGGQEVCVAQGAGRLAAGSP